MVFEKETFTIKRLLYSESKTLTLNIISFFFTLKTIRYMYIQQAILRGKSSLTTKIMGKDCVQLMWCPWRAILKHNSHALFSILKDLTIMSHESFFIETTMKVKAGNFSVTTRTQSHQYYSISLTKWHRTYQKLPFLIDIYIHTEHSLSIRKTMCSYPKEICVVVHLYKVYTLR